MVLTRIPQQAEKQTIQEFEPDAQKGALPGFHYFFWRTSLLPPWGDARRPKALWDFYIDPFNWAIQGAFAAIVKQIASTPYEIKGDSEHKILTRHYEKVLSGAQFDDFGGGFRGLISRVVLDYLRFDEGAFVEIIGGGNPMREINGRANGIAHLNGLRCAATGEPEHPVVYQARRTGTLHYLHRSRVARLVDLPDGVDDETGRGLSALSRAISIAQTMMYQSKYILQRLDDLPPAGILSLHNIKDWDDAVQLYEASRKRDGGSVWANVMTLESVEPDKPPQIQHIPFASVPEHFNPRDYTEMMVNALALALNVDPQDIWPLTGAPIGTGTQSSILASKAAGKMLGDLRTLITRVINFYVLPPSLEFNWKFKDTERDKEESLNQDRYSIIAKRIQDIIDPMGSNDILAKEIALQYLANTAETFADVLLDSEGGIRLPDDDPKEIGQETTQFTDTSSMDEVTAESDTPRPTQSVDETVIIDSDTPLQQKKDIQATRAGFEADVEDAIRAAVNGQMDRRRFGIVMRGHISKYGRRAFEDGLKHGGIDEYLSSDDMPTVIGLIAQQSQYVTDLGDAIFNGDVTPEQIAGKAELWFNKSIVPFEMAGITSADHNGLYEWVYGDTDHCDDCQRLNGQKHRMRDWVRSGWLPQADQLECHGFNCKCRLVKTTGRATGRF